ncbi:MAG: PilZ domain-containing protein [Syntrophobacterales bacterium]|nr:PilZ domain-containing protein [Syntrophobacterales bacterium]
MPCGPVCSLPPDILPPPQEERRRFPRLRLGLPVTFHLRVDGGRATLQGRGVLRDLSLGGAYFLTEAPLSFTPDLMVELAIPCYVPELDRTPTPRLYARGRVVRLENPPAPGDAWGVAVSFLEYLSFSPPSLGLAEMFKK